MSNKCQFKEATDNRPVTRVMSSLHRSIAAYLWLFVSSAISHPPVSILTVCTALHRACSSDLVDIVLLIANKGADIHCKGHVGKKALSLLETVDDRKHSSWTRGGSLIRRLVHEGYMSRKGQFKQATDNKPVAKVMCSLNRSTAAYLWLTVL